MSRGSYQFFCQLITQLFPIDSRKDNGKVAVFLLAALGFLGPLVVFAAPLTYSSNTAVSLTSPAVNFTIIASSTADALMVNATSVVLTLSSSTGGSFSLTSASRDLAIATSSSGGTISQSCTSGVASTTIFQSTGSSNYTITPTAAACVITISSVNSNVSGNGATITWTTNFSADSNVYYGTTVSYGSTASGSGGITSHSVSISGLSYQTTYHYMVSSAAGTTSATSSDATFTTPATPAQVVFGGGSGGNPYIPSAGLISALTPASSTPNATSSTAAAATSTIITLSLQDQLKALLAQLQSLQTQVGGQGSPQKFTKNLFLGSRGDVVVSLQQFLIAQNSGPVAQKLAAVGANGRFGPLTRKALIEFQKKAGIRPANGNFGPKTRAYINSLAR